MDKIIAYLKRNWARMLFLAFALVALCFVINGLFKQYRQTRTVYVLPDEKVDSVTTTPTQTEQSAQVRWDSLNKLNP